MKKAFLSISVALVFVAYSIVLRHQHSHLVIAPVATTTQSSPTPSSTSQSPTTATTPAPTSQSSSSKYKDGSFTGSSANAFYGNVQVEAVIASGKIASVNILDYPHDNPNSSYINQQAIPYLKQEAVQVQSSNVSIISGATFTSQAFIQSLTSALNQATQNS